MTAQEHQKRITDTINTAVINRLIDDGATVFAERDALAEEVAALKAKYEPSEATPSKPPTP